MLSYDVCVGTATRRERDLVTQTLGEVRPNAYVVLDHIVGFNIYGELRSAERIEDRCHELPQRLSSRGRRLEAGVIIKVVC
jgi:hypothetical protein